MRRLSHAFAGFVLYDPHVGPTKNDVSIGQKSVSDRNKTAFLAFEQKELPTRYTM